MGIQTRQIQTLQTNELVELQLVKVQTCQMDKRVKQTNSSDEFKEGGWLGQFRLGKVR